MKESFDRTTSKRIGKVLSVNPDPEIVYILEVNLKHANLEVISAQSGKEALIEVYKEKPDIIILDPMLHDIDGTEFCNKLKEAEYTRHIPIILITDKVQRNPAMGKITNGEYYYITKPFDPKDIINVILTYFKKRKRMEKLSPLTGLPNSNEASNELTKLIKQKKIFAAVYIAMNDLRSFNKIYGYDQGDRTIQLLAEIIIDAVRVFGNTDDLVCHLGGDKFVVISSPWKARTVCRRIIADFNRRIKALYTDQRLQQGYVTYESPIDIENQSPIMSLRIAVITNKDRTFYHHLEVSEAAAEQMDYLKRFPDRTSFFNYQKSNINPIDIDFANQLTPSISREEIKTTYEVLTWLDFIFNELNIPIIRMKDSLESLEQLHVKDLDIDQKNNLNIVRENVNRLNKIIEGFVDLTKGELFSANESFNEVNIGDIIDWAISQMKDLMEKQNIRISIEGVEGIGKLLIDRKKISQCFLYILRGEIQSSLPGEEINILVEDKDKEFFNIKVINPNHYIPQQRLSMLLRGQQKGVENDALKNQLYVAKLLAEALDGELHVISTKKNGTQYTITIPKKWQSIVQESKVLQLAVDVSRKQAHNELKNIKRQLPSLATEIPLTITNNLEKLCGKIQELGVLCNRSLFLCDEFRSQLEIQQNRLLQQEVEQIASLEAIVTICHEIAGSIGVDNLFNLSKSKRVAKYAQAIAKEMKLHKSNKQIIYYAALLEDIGLALSPSDMINQHIVDDTHKALSINKIFHNVWHVLSNVPYLSEVLNVIHYRYAQYSGEKRYSDVNARIDNIPEESKILAVADTFESMISSRPPSKGVPLELAVQNIVDNEGMLFDPHVVRTFLTLWKNNEFGYFSSKSDQDTPDT